MCCMSTTELRSFSTFLPCVHHVNLSLVTYIFSIEGKVYGLQEACASFTLSFIHLFVLLFLFCFVVFLSPCANLFY